MIYDHALGTKVFSKTLHNLKRILKSTPLRDFIALVLQALNMSPVTIYIFLLV